MIVTFTKLLVINIVVRSSSESDNNKLMFLSAGCLHNSISLRLAGDKEKKAISEAEANADTNKSNPAKTIAIIAETEGSLNCMESNIFTQRHK